MRVSLGRGGEAPQTDSADSDTLPAWLQMFAHMDLSGPHALSMTQDRYMKRGRVHPQKAVLLDSTLENDDKRRLEPVILKIASDLGRAGLERTNGL
jgi:hypothetical protein